MTDARMTQAIELDDRHPFDLEATAGSFDGALLLSAVEFRD